MKVKQKNTKYALVSVSDKTGVADFCRALIKNNYTIISTGGTGKLLSQEHIPFTPIQEITGNPECFDGRMKTISFQIESGILFDRSKKTHQKEAHELGIVSIDVVVCNLYPFEKTVAQKSVTIADAVENIDVGGPTMVRAAAKNFQHVLVVVDPNDYQVLGNQLGKKVSLEQRQQLAAKAFAHLSFYDAQIATFFGSTEFPEEITIPGRKSMDLRYGENPHQKAAVYLTPGTYSPFKDLKKWAGRDLSLINITDINAGIESVRLFKEPAAVIIKHNSPCGIALGTTSAQALQRAIDADPESAFGGVIVLNSTLDTETAKVISSFKEERRSNIDIIASPNVKPNAVEALISVRKTLGIYSFGALTIDSRTNVKWIDGGFVLQTADSEVEESFKNWEIATKVKPTKQQLEQMQIAWKFLTKIPSNAVIVVDSKLPMTRGIGSRQTSRVRSTRLALEQAGAHANGAILASDSFFPFDDSVRLAGQFGIKAIIQQGDSINDKASIAAADELGLVMVLTHRRAFWH